MSTIPVLISAGAVLGKANLVQLAVMVLMEAAAFRAVRIVDKKFFHVSPRAVRGLGRAWWGRVRCCPTLMKFWSFKNKARPRVELKVLRRH